MLNSRPLGWDPGIQFSSCQSLPLGLLIPILDFLLLDWCSPTDWLLVAKVHPALRFSGFLQWPGSSPTQFLRSHPTMPPGSPSDAPVCPVWTNPSVLFLSSPRDQGKGICGCSGGLWSRLSLLSGHSREKLDSHSEGLPSTGPGQGHT